MPGRFLTCVAFPAAAAALLAALAAAPPAAQAGPIEDLPDGPGKRILLASCTQCHELIEMMKLSGYYDRAQWRALVETMVEYGAVVAPGDREILADYLTRHLGKRE